MGFSDAIDPEANGNRGRGIIPEKRTMRENNTSMEFGFWHPDGTPIDLTVGVTARFKMCPYGQYDNPVLDRVLVVNKTETNVGTLVLESEATKYLDFEKYVCQVYLETDEAKPQKYVQHEGTMFVFPFITDEIS